METRQILLLIALVVAVGAYPLSQALRYYLSESSLSFKEAGPAYAIHKAVAAIVALGLFVLFVIGVKWLRDSLGFTAPPPFY